MYFKFSKEEGLAMIRFYSPRVDPFQREVLLRAVLTKEEFGRGDLTEEKPGIFRLYDGNLAFIPNDALPWFRGETRPGYPNCGIISAQLNDYFREKVNWFVRTDYVPRSNYLTSGIPPRLLDRAMVRLPATTIIPIRFSCYSRFEPDAPGEAGWAWTLAGGIGEGLTQGDMLDFPCFIPVAKSGPIRLELFLKGRLGFFAEKRGLANYLYGLSVLLHLSNRGQALKAGFDRPLQKVKFGIFPKKLPNYGPTHGNRWERATIRGKAEVLFGDLLSAAGFPRNAWKKMPGFNIEQFAEFAWWNWKAGTIRLVGYYGTPHDGAYRSVSDTQMGVDLVRAGNPARGEMLLRGYACSAAAGVASEGNEVSKDILHQLGRQHWRLMEQLTG